MPLSRAISAPLAVVILAGGGGTRLWPRSRKSLPKQLIDIVIPGRTMLQMTAERISPGLVAANSVFVITGEQYAGSVREQMPDVPPQNVVGEPMPRDSAPAMAFMAALIEHRLGSNAIMIALPSDHDIRDVEAFHNCLLAAAFASEQGYLVTLGIVPGAPDSGFGYIQRGESMHTGSVPAFHVKSFREKPDHATARGYLASGEYYWNAGMYIGRAGTFRELYKRYLPEMEPHLEELIAAHGTEHQASTMARQFPQLTKISFDFAIAEKAAADGRVAVVPAQIGWSDVGSWNRLAELLEEQADEHGNIAVSGAGAPAHRLIDTRGTMVHAPHKLVATLGLDDVVIIDTPDAILIAAKDRAEDVKKIVESLQQEGRLELL